jgi:hypothetical protein
VKAERIAPLVTAALAILGGVVLIGAGWTPDVHPDADAYWLAAERIRDGAALYGGPRGDETEIYRYAPWFAFAWVPLTFLGQEAAYFVWRGVLLVASLAAVWPLLRRPGPASLTLATLMFALLISNLPAANVTALMVGALVLTANRRTGPVVVGMAASLKIFPILLVVGYLAERRWRDAGVAVGVMAILWVHLLAFDLSTFPLQVGGGSFFLGGISLYSIAPAAWLVAALVLGASVLLLAIRGSRWTWLAITTSVSTVVPRVWLPEAAYALVAVPRLLAARTGEDAQSGQERR